MKRVHGGKRFQSFINGKACEIRIAFFDLFQQSFTMIVFIFTFTSTSGDVPQHLFFYNSLIETKKECKNIESISLFYDTLLRTFLWLLLFLKSYYFECYFDSILDKSTNYPMKLFFQTKIICLCFCIGIDLKEVNSI